MKLPSISMVRKGNTVLTNKIVRYNEKQAKSCLVKISHFNAAQLEKLESLFNEDVPGDIKDMDDKEGKCILLLLLLLFFDKTLNSVRLRLSPLSPEAAEP